jgi:hypothetical protein
MLQTKGKLQSVEVDNIVCDFNFFKCERTLGSSLKGMQLSQDLLPMIVEQLAHMKIGTNLHF